MNTKVIHRRYPDSDWDFKAIQTIINDNGTKRMIVFYTLKNKGKSKKGVEIYSGGNYIVGSKDRSSSRSYQYPDYPVKYKSIVEELKKVHAKTKWSSAKKVDKN